MPDSPTLAIVIVSFNVRDDLDACLRAIPAAAGNVTRTIVVVDNGSSDGTVEMLREQWPEVQVIRTGANLGFTKANNLGIRSTRSELVLLLNPDTIPSAGSVARLVQTLHAHPEAAAIGPRLIDAAGVPELSFGWPLTPIGELRQKTLQRALDGRGAGRLQRWITHALNTPGAHDWVSGACLLARRDDLEAVGLLDERYFMYAEDIDLCKAFRQRGRTVRFEPAAEVQHLRGRSAEANPQLERMRRQSQMAYYRKHHRFWAPALRWYLRVRGKS